MTRSAYWCLSAVEDRNTTTEFIPILEDTGLIVPVGEWVLQTVCRQLKQWQQQGLAVRPVAVNVSARQFTKGLAGVIQSALNESEVDASLLEIELTETMVMRDPAEAVQTLQQMKALGINLSIDGLRHWLLKLGSSQAVSD